MKKRVFKKSGSSYTVLQLDFPFHGLLRPQTVTETVAGVGDREIEREREFPEGVTTGGPPMLIR